jgi:pyruvate/2-oxoglutarate dehydrogenase complex dihydrolipoamide acyltransferase (E2) component
MPTPIHTPRVNNNDDVVRLIRMMVKPGDWVDAGALVAEVETDKASFTVESEQEGFVLTVVPQLEDMIAVGSVLCWLGKSADEAPPQAAPAPDDRLVAEPTVKAAQLLAKYGLRAIEVPASGARLSVKDIEDYIATRSQGTPAPHVERPAERPASQPPLVPGAVEALTPSERGMLRTVLWQRDEAVPGYVEIEYDAAAWDRAASEYQRSERLMLSPLLSLMAYRLVQVARENRRLNATIAGEDRFVYGPINLGFTVQSDTTLYLVVVENAQNLSCRELIDRLGTLQRTALTHRLRAPEASGATISFSSMARWNTKRHIPVLPPQTSLIVAHASASPEGRGILGATYDHRVLTGFEAVSGLERISRPEGFT